MPPGDIAGLKDAIERLAADPDLRRQMGAAARARAESLSLDSFAVRLGAIYRGLGKYANGSAQPVLKPISETDEKPVAHARGSEGALLSRQSGCTSVFDATA